MANILSGHGNIGFGRACNLGAQRASGEYLLYLNPDTEMVSVDLDALAAILDRRPVGILAATLIDTDGSFRPTIRRRYASWLLEFLIPHLLRILSQYAPRPRYFEQAEGRGVFTVDGAVFLVAASEFKDLGGFDERFFMYSEDADLALRYREAGWPLRAVSALLARHEGGTSAPTPMLLALSFLGWLEYTKKWHGGIVAVIAAVFACVIYSVVLLVLRVLVVITGMRRISAKAEQIAEMLSYIATEGQPNDSRRAPRYHYAGLIATSIFRPFLRRNRIYNSTIQAG
jgi:GT2 family glycosyltransferase